MSSVFMKKGLPKKIYDMNIHMISARKCFMKVQDIVKTISQILPKFQYYSFSNLDKFLISEIYFTWEKKQ